MMWRLRLATAALCLPAFAAIADVRHATIPAALRGTWALNAQGCSKSDSVIVLSEKRYSGPQGRCDVRWVIESAGERGTIYSARLQCSGPESGQPPPESDLILMPSEGNQLSVGDDFDHLKSYQRCP